MNNYIKFIMSISAISLLLIGFSSYSSSEGEKTYQEFCATCHGDKLQGGLSKSLADGVWQFGSSDTEIINNIKTGIAQNGMPSFKDILNEAEIKDLVSFI
ncbi:MAG: cytochrome c, partial [Ignavibacteriae bacterium]|nr:cytochrome c [Ignavibacteriota bacterium]